MRCRQCKLTAVGDAFDAMELSKHADTARLQHWREHNGAHHVEGGILANLNEQQGLKSNMQHPPINTAARGGYRAGTGISRRTVMLSLMTVSTRLTVPLTMSSTEPVAACDRRK